MFELFFAIFLGLVSPSYNNIKGTSCNGGQTVTATSTSDHGGETGNKPPKKQQ